MANIFGVSSTAALAGPERSPNDILNDVYNVMHGTSVICNQPEIGSRVEASLFSDSGSSVDHLIGNPVYRQ